MANACWDHRNSARYNLFGAITDIGFTSCTYLGIGNCDRTEAGNCLAPGITQVLDRDRWLDTKKLKPTSY